MTTPKIVQAFQQYQKASAIKRKAYFDDFEAKMIYRTTKTENPEVTLKMVRIVLRKQK